MICMQDLNGWSGFLHLRPHEELCQQILRRHDQFQIRRQDSHPTKYRDTSFCSFLKGCLRLSNHSLLRPAKAAAWTDYHLGSIQSPTEISTATTLLLASGEMKCPQLQEEQDRSDAPRGRSCPIILQPQTAIPNAQAHKIEISVSYRM